MKHSTKLLVIIATALSTIAFAGAGWALWTTTGTGSASGKAAALAAPTAVTVSSPSSGTVAVGWTASSTASPNATPAGYYVQRLGGTPSPAPACGTSATVLTAATSCSDTGVSAGTYTYKVTAVLGSWTAQSLASGSVTVSADTTAPTLVAGSLQMFDTNANGKVDQVTATFSETLASSTATAPWTLTNVPSNGSLLSVSTSGTVATLTLTEGAGPANTAVGTFTVALAANAAGIRDAAGNQSSFAATAPVDKAAPVITLTESDGPSTKETFSGTTTETTGTLTIKVYAGSTATGPIVQTYTINGPALTWSLTNANSDLATGTQYTAQATHVDAATNTSNQPSYTFQGH
jgi:hypothetical protein